MICDDESLWCCYRWATNPNAAQLAVATVRVIPKRLTDADRARKWRQKNRERYNEVQRDYRERKRNERKGNSIRTTEVASKAAAGIQT
jgi:hypothetical protein